VCFSAEVLQLRREWDDIFQVLKEKTAHQEHFIQQSCPSEMKEIKTFTDRQELREFITSRLAL